jgi:hypothetical protein
VFNLLINQLFRDVLEAPVVGTKLEGLLLDEMEEDDFNPRAYESPPPLLAPPPKPAQRRTPMTNSTTPSNLSHHQQQEDPFGMGDFATVPPPTQVDLENAIGILDKKILEMKVLV